MNAVRGHGRQLPVLVERLLVCLAATPAGCDLAERFVVGIEQDITRGAVYGNQGARGDDGAGIVQPGHRGDVDRARENGCVGRPASGVGHECGQPGPVELRDDRRRDLVGDQDEGALEAFEQVARITGRSQVHAQPPHHVGNVPFALAQVRVVCLVEERRDLFQGSMKG